MFCRFSYHPVLISDFFAIFDSLFEAHCRSFILHDVQDAIAEFDVAARLERNQLVLLICVLSVVTTAVASSLVTLFFRRTLRTVLMNLPDGLNAEVDE